MTGTAHKDGRRRRRWTIVAFAALAVLIMLPFWVMEATDPAENIALGRNEAAREAR